MASKPGYGTFVRESVYADCAGCGEFTSFPPGVRTPDGAEQVRTCPAPTCGTTITTPAYYTAPPEDSDRFDLD